MVKLESFSVWIYDKKDSKANCPYQEQISYIFSQKPPCNLPKNRFIHLSIVSDGQHLIELNAEYVYGSSSRNTIYVKYSQEELSRLENNLIGKGSFVDRIKIQVDQLSSCQKENLLREFQIPCFGDSTTTLIHLFTFLLAITLVAIVWLDDECFWKNKLLPLHIRFPCQKGIVTKKILRMMVIYFIYLFSMNLDFELRPILELILSFINIWDTSFIDGEDFNTDFFNAQLNLGFLKYVVWQLTDKKEASDYTSNIIRENSCNKKRFSHSDQDLISSNNSNVSISSNFNDSFFNTNGSNNSLSSTFVTGDSLEEEYNVLKKKVEILDVTTTSSYQNVDTSSNYPIEKRIKKINYKSSDQSNNKSSDLDLRQTYCLLENKKKDVEKSGYQVGRYLSSHFSTFSQEVIEYAMVEVVKRLEGCVEEYIHKSYPRIENYIQSALKERSDYFFLLKEQLDLEVNNVRDICQQAFLVLEAVPQYEERIRYLENEIKQLKTEINNETNLHRKVEHLQTTVMQLLRAVRCRS